MNLKNAVSAMQKEHYKDTLTPLYTPWGEAIEKEQETNVLPEYPRPQLRRSNYQMLNGKWHYAINQNPAASETFSADGEILVPFSPEALLSGVHRQVLPGMRDVLPFPRKSSPFSIRANTVSCILVPSTRLPLSISMGKRWLPMWVDISPLKWILRLT